MGDMPPQIKKWAKNEVKKYKNCEFEQTSSGLVSLFGNDCSLLKEVIHSALEERVASKKLFEKLCLEYLDDENSKLLSKKYASEIVGINKVLSNSESSIISSLFSFRSIYTLSELLIEESTVQKGRVAIQSIDLSKTELRSETLDKMTENMKDGTIYDYYFSSPCDDCVETVYKIKAQILARNPELDVNKQMRFWNISDWDKAEEYVDYLKNIIYWECEAGNEKAFILLCGWKDTPSSVFGELDHEALNEFKGYQNELWSIRRQIAA